MSRRVVLSADDEPMRFLAALCVDTLRVIEDRDGWAVTSPAIDRTELPSEAMEVGRLLAAHLAGLYHLQTYRTASIVAAHVADEWATGRRDGYAFVGGEIAPSGVLLLGEEAARAAPMQAAESLARFVSRAGGDASVSLVLVLAGQPPTWPTLYKILETIEGDVGGERALARMQWVPASELKLFTRNANAIENVLRGGRHARSDFTVGNASNIMTLREADHLIVHLVQRWLAKRGTE